MFGSVLNWPFRLESVGVNDEGEAEREEGGVFSADELPCLDSLMWASDPQQHEGTDLSESVSSRCSNSRFIHGSSQVLLTPHQHNNHYCQPAVNTQVHPLEDKQQEVTHYQRGH